MGLTLRLGGKHHEYGDSHEEMEMRRRRRSAMDYGDDYDDMEMRRRRRSEMYPWDTQDTHRPMPWGDTADEMEMRRRRRSEMGFDVRPNEWDDIRTEMHHLKKKVDELAGSGYASVKKLAPNLEGVFEDATKIIQNPPSTWPMYLQRRDYKGIAKMEGKELMAALESGKGAKDIRKELVHTVAALLLMTEE